jgi:outer membrane cobalamin receptor
VLSAAAALALPWHASAAEDASRGLTLEEVIVTAQKRSETLQRTSAAVTAITVLELVVNCVLPGYVSVQLICRL